LHPPQSCWSSADRLPPPLFLLELPLYFLKLTRVSICSRSVELVEFVFGLVRPPQLSDELRTSAIPITVERALEIGGLLLNLLVLSACPGGAISNWRRGLWPHHRARGGHRRVFWSPPAVDDVAPPSPFIVDPTTRYRFTFFSELV
jgi:hypothetical protein